MDFENIKDPKNLCNDISGLARLGNGNVEVNLRHASELEDIIELVEQAFEEQMNG